MVEVSETVPTSAEPGTLVSQSAAVAHEWSPVLDFVNPSTGRDAGGKPDDVEALVDAMFGVDSMRFERAHPETRLLNAWRMHAARQALVDQGTFTVKEIATTLGRVVNTVHKQVRRAQDRSELFTVAINGELHIPAILLDDALETRPVWQPVIEALNSVGMSAWGIWRWIAEPNAGLSGEVAAQLIESDVDRVYAAAQRRAEQTVA